MRKVLFLSFSLVLLITGAVLSGDLLWKLQTDKDIKFHQLVDFLGRLADVDSLSVF